MSKNKVIPPPVDYEAHFAVPIPPDQYMHNVLLTFVHGIPPACYRFCNSQKHPNDDIESLPPAEQQVCLRDYVEERLRELADYEYRAWINGAQPFVTPRELQLWRLKIFVQYIWFWNLPEDDDLGLIFNLTKRRAANLTADFFARFRKTLVYPVALRRLYWFINTTEPESTKEHPKAQAKGNIYRISSSRFVLTAQYLLEDMRTELPGKRMATPYLWDKEEYRMWMDVDMVDVMKTNEKLRKRLYEMYKVPS